MGPYSMHAGKLGMCTSVQAVMMMILTYFLLLSLLQQDPIHSKLWTRSMNLTTTSTILSHPHFHLYQPPAATVFHIQCSGIVSKDVILWISSISLTLVLGFLASLLGSLAACCRDTIGRWSSSLLATMMTDIVYIVTMTSLGLLWELMLIVGVVFVAVFPVFWYFLGLKMNYVKVSYGNFFLSLSF
uniref:Uncharacterized protein n=1 Tax=Cacopsylla melanoneura TaxID=428564 RepID=A0A8D9A6Q2_9HEMI